MFCETKYFYPVILSALLLLVAIGAVLIGLSGVSNDLDTGDADNWKAFVEEFKGEHAIFDEPLHPYYRFEITDPEMESALRTAGLSETEIEQEMSWTGPNQQYGSEHYVKDINGNYTNELLGGEDAREAREIEYIKRFYDGDGKYKTDARVEFNGRTGLYDKHKYMVKRFVEDRADFFEGTGKQTETQKAYSKVGRYVVGGAVGAGAAAAVVKECFMLKNKHTVRKRQIYLIVFLLVAIGLAAFLALNGKSVLSFIALSVLSLSVFGVGGILDSVRRMDIRDAKRNETVSDGPTKVSLDKLKPPHVHEPTAPSSVSTKHDAAQVDVEEKPQASTRRLLNELQFATL